MIKIRMLKLCRPSLCKPLSIIFKSCLSQIKFPVEWKKANVVPMRETYHKWCIKNYQLFPLFPTSREIFKRLLFNELYKFLNENDLLFSNQSGLRPSDSCMNHLLSINHEIYQFFDNDID